MSIDRVYLASSSPRRRELLHQIGVNFTVMHADVDESVGEGEAPLDYVCRLAQAKAEAVLARLQVEGLQSCPVLGADTSVVLGQQILGKPENEEHAVAMLMMLSGKTHQVITAVALAEEEQTRMVHSITDVSFREISEQEAHNYWLSGEPADKAGGYGIQGFGAILVERLSGSYSGVVGLPLYETANLLKQADVRLWKRSEKTA